jgi:hypothetical protein
MVHRNSWIALESRRVCHINTDTTFGGAGKAPVLVGNNLSDIATQNAPGGPVCTRTRAREAASASSRFHQLENPVLCDRAGLRA